MCENRKLWTCADCGKIVGPVDRCKCGCIFKLAIEVAYELLQNEILANKITEDGLKTKLDEIDKKELRDAEERLKFDVGMAQAFMEKENG